MRTVQNTSSRTEPAPKRLCSKVSTPSTRVIYAAEEASEDVQKIRCSGNVFGTQGHDMDSIETINQSSIFRDDVLEEEEFDDIFQIQSLDDLECYERIKNDGELTEGGDSLSNGEKSNLRTGVSNMQRRNSAIFETHNVHFAANKDSLSHHFKKFGDVLKVIILIDTTTGQPKGSAFIEFFRMESAVQALSLDGTYFMSRVIKVIRKAAAHHQGAPLMVHPRIARGSLLSPMLRRRVAFPRGCIIPSFVRSPFPHQAWSP